MNKQSSYRPDRSTSVRATASEALAVGSIAFPPLLLLTLPIAFGEKRKYEEAVQETADRYSEAESEADSIAKTWESSRHDGETGVDVDVNSSDGSGAHYSYCDDD